MDDRSEFYSPNVEAGEKESMLPDDGSSVSHHINMSRQSRSRARTIFNSLLWSFCFVVVFLSVGGLGFVIGRMSSTRAHTSTFPIPDSSSSSSSTFSDQSNTGASNRLPFVPERTTMNMTSDRAFLAKPSQENAALWETLYPKNHGLFGWPEVNPTRATLAGFHQLHCVDALRKAWYVDQDIKSGLKNGQNVTHIKPFSPDHVLHCVEFLRNTIMCHADTTLQTERYHNSGLLAFGVEYQCRDWFQVVDWVDQRNLRMYGTTDAWPDPV